MHTRCPHCHSPIEIVEDDSLKQIECPSCGSSFSLLSVDEESTAAFRDGTLTIAHFELLEQIGVGHYGTVWKARDTQLDRTVAVKLPRKDQLDETESEQFFREARAAAQLNHPNIVSVHEVGRDEEAIYIVSDYVDGANLREWTTGQRLTPREAAELCSTIAGAVHHAHEAGVIHRDLKPSNVMLDPDGTPHVMDFGLAKREAGEITMTVEGRILGTPAYMPPEQARGEGHEADRRSDVYSLGVILYELLTGELPFRGETRMLLVQILRDEPASPRKLDARIPKDLETICLKCLEKEPGRRYQTASDFGEELQRYLRNEPIHARPVSRIERGLRWCRRNPSVAGLSTLVALSLLIGSAVSSYFAIESNRNAAESKQNAEEARTALITATEEKAQADVARRRAEALHYVSQIGLAHRVWEDGNVAHARDVLSACRRDLRGWEHDYLFTLFNRNQTTLQVNGNVNSVALSPDGRRIVSGGVGVVVWDALNGEQIFGRTGHLREVNSVAFSPDGSRIVSGSHDTMILVWNASTGEDVLTLKGHSGPVTSVAFSPDGQRIVSGSDDQTLKVWNASTGEEVLTLKGHSGSVGWVSFSPDGSRIVSGSHDKMILVWNASTGEDVLTLKGHAGPVTRVAFSPDGSRIVSGSDDQMLKVWDAATGNESFTFKGHGRGVTSVAFSPDGSRIVSGSKYESIKVWDASKSQEMVILKVSTNPSVSFSPDGSRIVGKYDANLVKVWNAKNGKEMLTFEGHGTITSVAFSPDGSQIVTGSTDKTITIWNAASGEEVLTLKGHSGIVGRVSFSPDGSRIVGGFSGWHFKVWDVSTGEETLTLAGHAGEVRCLAFSPDGTRIVGGRKRIIKVWDAVTGDEVLTLKGHRSRITNGAGVQATIKLGVQGIINSVAFSPNGRRIISGSWDGWIKVWDPSTGVETLTIKGHSGGSLGSVSFSPDGRRIVSGSSDGIIRIWDASKREPQPTITILDPSHPAWQPAEQ